MRKKFKVTRTLRKKINELAEKVGCPLNWRRAPGIAWNGKDVACMGEDASNIIHDIAHYTIATKAERKHFDFGLGPSPSTTTNEYDDKRLEPMYSYRVCSKKEARASALGIYLEKQMGLPWEDTADYHSWRDPNDLKEAWESLRRQMRKFK